MKGEVDYDLSGRWSGLYNLPDGLPSNSFEAEIRETGGMISGITTEMGDTPDCYGTQLHAVIEGNRKGNAVHFTKTYDYLQRAPDIVHYAGTVEPGGDEIAGTWAIPGDWSGTFLMVRARSSGEAAQRRVSEEV